MPRSHEVVGEHAEEGPPIDRVLSHSDGITESAGGRLGDRNDSYLLDPGQPVEVPDDELIECTDDEKRLRLVEQYVTDAFDQHVTWCFSIAPDFSELDLPEPDEEAL